jgi:hypothetical protein
LIVDVDRLTATQRGARRGSHHALPSGSRLNELYRRKLSMQLSAEIRWFWRMKPPLGLEEWFCGGDRHPCPAGGGHPHTDEYLRDSGDLELGIKRRHGKKGVEIKGLVATSENNLEIGPFTGSVQIWGKWESTAMDLDMEAVVAVEKLRWLRKFATSSGIPLEIPLDGEEHPLETLHSPSRVCSVEFTKVAIADSDLWWTFGFEAVGTIRTVEEDLRRVALLVADRWESAHLDGLLASYPTWLKEHALESLVAHV